MLHTNQARYFPIQQGRYHIGPGLSPFGKDFGNSDQDQKVFQFDDQIENYLQQKRLSRSEGIEKYYPMPQGLDVEALHEVCKFIIQCLVSEYPKDFQLKTNHRSNTLICRLSRAELEFDADLRLVGSSKKYRDLFDALASQVQEDLAIWKMDKTKEWLAAVHLSFPNHWDPAEKVGQSFMAVHKPVAGFEGTYKNIAPNIVKSIIEKGPFVRFAWGLASDNDLNHHPDYPGRSYADSGEFYLRVERQTLHPFPKAAASLFTIRTYFYAVSELTAEQLERLIQAVESMNEEELIYKGLNKDFEVIVNKLKAAL